MVGFELRPLESREPLELRLTPTGWAFRLNDRWSSGYYNQRYIVNILRAHGYTTKRATELVRGARARYRKRLKQGPPSGFCGGPGRLPPSRPQYKALAPPSRGLVAQGPQCDGGP